MLAENNLIQMVQIGAFNGGRHSDIREKARDDEAPGMGNPRSGACPGAEPGRGVLCVLAASQDWRHSQGALRRGTGQGRATLRGGKETATAPYQSTVSFIL